MNGANQYSTDPTVSGAGGAVFPFVAQLVRVVNDKATPVYLSLNSTVGTTAGFRTCGGETFEVAIPTQMIGWASTTTSTGTTIRVGAWGL